jgi:hypothetical protein
MYIINYLYLLNFINHLGAILNIILYSTACLCTSRRNILKILNLNYKKTTLNGRVLIQVLMMMALYTRMCTLHVLI